MSLCHHRYHVYTCGSGTVDQRVELLSIMKRVRLRCLRSSSSSTCEVAPMLSLLIARRWPCCCDPRTDHPNPNPKPKPKPNRNAYI